MDGTIERSSKRRRLEESDQSHESPIRSADQLYELLRFRQSISPEVKNNVNSFKNFLTEVNRNEDLASQASQLRIIRKYCDDQTASSKEHLDFPDLISTWSLAVQSNNDAVCSAVPAALAQFFKTISGILEFREFGLSLCHSLMKRDQVKLFDRGLSASRSREHLISPCLRLLTEIVTFDGGTLANHVFTRRDVLFKRLETLLEYSHSRVEGDRRRPTVRRMAIRLIIANLKFLDAAAKSEFITQLRMVRAWIYGLSNDGDDIVVDVLRSINTSVTDDPNVLRTSKSRFFGSENLISLAALYDYEPDPNYPEADTNVREALLITLAKICATRKGVLSSQNGWYPLGYDTQLYDGNNDDFIDLGLDSPLYFDDYSVTVPVKNTALSTFTVTLKPELDTLQAQLLLQIFKAAPELVAPYFSKKSKFIVPAGDDPLWRGQFGFLFSVVQLPVPKNLGLSETVPSTPPPISIVIESILPRPFDRTVTTRCFTLNDEILILSGSRLLTVALDKLHQVLKIFDAAADNKVMWRQASARLVEAVLQRIPKFKDVVDTVTRYKTSNESVRLSLFECIASYYRILPEATAGSKFDVGSTISEILTRVKSEDESGGDRDVLKEQIHHLIVIADHSPATRWFNKSDAESLSLFMTLLQYATNETSETTSIQVRSILASAAVSAGFVASSTSSFAALQTSLQPSKKFKPCQELQLFVDNSIHRAVQKPVRYLDRIESVQQMLSDKKALSLLACSVAEQWEFALKKYGGQKEVIKNITDWIARYYSILESIGENFRVIGHFQEEMMSIADKKAMGYLQTIVDKIRTKPIEIDLQDDELPNGVSVQDTTTESKQAIQASTVELSTLLGTPTPTPTSLEGIDRWDNTTDLELAVQSGRIGKLIGSTASSEEEIRRQAFQSLQTLSHIVDESTYPEKAQLYLLLGEISETVRQYGLDTPLPSVVAELGARLLSVLCDPAHKLFGKANRFVLRGPVWEVNKLISHWTDKILFCEPESDDIGASGEEMEWLLQWLIDGLKTTSDLELYRRSGTWEKILALYSSPGSGRPIKKLILTLLWRTIYIGGADTLITRAGLHQWLRIAISSDQGYENIIRQLQRALVEASDEQRIEEWEKARPQLKKIE